MEKILFTVFVYLQVTYVFPDKYEILPPIYEIEDYVACFEKNGIFCKVDARLSSDYKNTTLWGLINESRYDKYSQDRTFIHRGVCVSDTSSYDIQSIKRITENRVNKELKSSKLFSNIQGITCTSRDTEITLYDILLILIILLYLFLILFSTIYDKRKRKLLYEGESIRDRIFVSLSLLSNWEKLTKYRGGEDYNKLKSIQGIRFYNMLIIIAIHSKLSYALVYLKNPEVIGNLLKGGLLEILIILVALLVQTFFLISSWILTSQIYNIYRDHEEFTIKQALILILNRYFRFGVCTIILTSFLKFSWHILYDGPITFDVANVVRTACIENWWKTVLFVNNNLFFKEMCYPPSWYLSVDFQLYSMAIITIYVILRFKLNEWKVISFLIFISYLIHGLVVYHNDMDIFIKLSANFFKSVTLYRSIPLNIFYTSTYSCWTTSLVGISFGIVYTKSKHRIINKNCLLSILWLFGFFGLPGTVLWLISKEYKGITAAILAPLVKPLFCVGTGIGILGMSHNIGGIVKRLCENKFVVIMSNFSFSVYIFQFLFVFFKGVFSYSLVEYGLMQLVKSFLFVDAPLSLLAGIIGAFIFEQPGINLQKMFLPQSVRQKRQKLRQHDHKD